MYLYFFILGGSIGGFSQEASFLYLMMASIFNAYNSYRYLVFKTVSDNIIFFTGFFTIAIYKIIQAFLLFLDYETRALYMILPFALYLGYNLILNRVQ